MHPQLADFAQECFDTQGRGVIRVGIPVIPRTPLPGPFSTSMTYESAEDLRREPARDETLMTNKNKDVLLRLVDDYDPQRQAVVVFEFADTDPIVGTIDLATMIIDEA
jgi:hypothetical protein